ncbi:hypothetical protein C3F00_035800, partial [Pseudomonas sp. MWU13-2860]
TKAIHMGNGAARTQRFRGRDQSFFLKDKKAYNIPVWRSPTWALPIVAARVELLGDQESSAPYAGAAGRVQFASRRGQAVLIKGWLADGSALPMGAMVYAEDGANIGMVGQGGQAYARVGARKASLRVKWGDDADSQCVLPYTLADETGSRSIVRLEAACAPLPNP